MSLAHVNSEVDCRRIYFTGLIIWRPGALTIRQYAMLLTARLRFTELKSICGLAGLSRGESE